MSTASRIEWTDTTWNPMLGCERVSDGCDGCYAIDQARIRAGNPHPRVAAAFAGLTERRDGRIDWTGQVNLLPDRLPQPFTWARPRRVFVNSLSDLFHDAVDEEFLADVFAVMAATPRHTYQILTKRHARARSVLSSLDFQALVAARLRQRAAELGDRELAGRARALDSGGWPLPNIWLGVSIENQKWAQTRIPALLATPAAVRWLSCEPLLGPVDLTPWLKHVQLACRACDPGGPMDWHSGHLWGRCRCTCHPAAPARLDWVVAGGESGHKARPMDPNWVRALRDICQAAKVPFLFKQWGEWAPIMFGAGGCRPSERFVGDPIGPLEYRQIMRRVGKSNAGRELDDRAWDEYPTVSRNGAAVTTAAHEGRDIPGLNARRLMEMSCDDRSA